MKPEQHLIEIQRAYPKAHRYLDQARASGLVGGADWPEWCFAPREITMQACIQSCIDAGVPITGDNYRQHSGPITHAHALLAWRATQGVYCIHPALQEQLWHTPCTGAIPVEALSRLPEWCPYVVVDPPREGIVGFWVRHDLAMGEYDLLWIVDYGDSLRPQSLGLEFADDLEGALLATAEADEKALRSTSPAALRVESQCLPRPIIEGMLSLTLYLCSRAEVRPSNASAERAGQPGNPKPVKTRHGPRLYPPDHPRVWEVGWRTGPALEAALAGTAQGEGTGRGVRPHVRRAHWHSYWVGQGRTRLELRWVHPVLVGEGEIPIVQREVK